MADIDAIAAAFLQTERLLTISTSLGDNELLVEHASITEGMNALFEMQVSVCGKRADIQAAELVGRTADLGLELTADGPRRPWNGLVTSFAAAQSQVRGFRRYRLTMRPKLWLLSQKSDCRIWQNMTSLDVLNTLLTEHNLPSANVNVLSAPPAQLYSVQWNETDLDFLRRRLEEDGLFFWHTHAVGSHIMQVADHPVAYGDAAEPAPRFSSAATAMRHLTEWTQTYHFTPGQWAVADWNFETPGTVPLASTTSMISVPGNAAAALYEFPGRIDSPGAAAAMAKLRMQATEYGYERIEGAADIRTMAPAEKFTPTDPTQPMATFDAAVIIEITHVIDDATFANQAAQPTYDNAFVAIPAATPATPPRLTPRPRIDGTQVALIAGPPGEEIYTDEFGRVKLWFPWDRRAKKDGTDTCWMRVAQSWAGGTWGGQIIPRIGMEAMVSYLEGDPDRPIIVGLVPNPTQGVPYDLPANKTRMVIRSNTYKGTGFNELALEDLPGAERFHMNAQHDHTIHVGNNQTERVDANQIQSIGGNRSVEVGGNQKTEVGGSVNIVVGAVGPLAPLALAGVAGLLGQTAGLLSSAGGGAVAMSVAAGAFGFLEGDALTARQGVVGGPSPRADAGLALTGAGGGLAQAIGDLFGLSGVMNTVIAGHKTESVGISSTEQVGTCKVINIGQTFFTQVGNTYKIAAGDQFIIECGAAKLIMTSDGTVTILGTKFNFTASGPVQVTGAPIDMN